MFGFGKKKVSEKVIVDSFVRALIDDMEEAYAYIIDELKQIPDSEKYILLPKDAKQKFTITILSLELIALPNLFRNDQAKRIEELCIELFAEYKKLNKDFLYAEIEPYKRDFNEHASKGLNPILAVSELLYKKLGFNDFQSKDYPEIKGPEPILVTGMSGILVALCGRWKRLKESFKII
jgi:hypothetical protein